MLHCLLSRSAHIHPALFCHLFLSCFFSLIGLSLLPCSLFSSFENIPILHIYLKYWGFWWNLFGWFYSLSHLFYPSQMESFPLLNKPIAFCSLRGFFIVYLTDLWTADSPNSTLPMNTDVCAYPYENKRFFPHFYINFSKLTRRRCVQIFPWNEFINRLEYEPGKHLTNKF